MDTSNPFQVRGYCLPNLMRTEAGVPQRTMTKVSGNYYIVFVCTTNQSQVQVNSATSLEPPSSKTLTAPSSISSSDTVYETPNDSAGNTIKRPLSNKKDVKPDGNTPSPNSEGLRAKFKNLFHKRKRSQRGDSPQEVTSNLSLENLHINSNEPTPKVPKPPVMQFRWPSTTKLASDSAPLSSESTPKLQYQPRQPSPPPSQKSLATDNATPFRPLPPEEFRAALVSKPTTAPSARGPPPAPSASANERYSASAANSNTNYSSSAHPGSAISGYSTSTSSELADVPSRLPYQSPGYSPGYSR